MTTKPSIRKGGVLYKSGVYARKVLCLTPGDLPCALGRRVRLKLAERRGIDVDRMGEVSRGNSSLAKGETKARTVEGKAPGGDKPGTASVKAEHCYPRGEGIEPDWHTG